VQKLPFQTLLVANGLVKLFPSLQFLSFSCCFDHFYIDFVYPLPENSGWIQSFEHATAQVQRTLPSEVSSMEMLGSLVQAFCQTHRVPLHPDFFKYYLLSSQQTTTVTRYGQLIVPEEIDENSIDLPFALVSLKPSLFAPPHSKAIRGYRLTGIIKEDRKQLKAAEKVYSSKANLVSIPQIAAAAQLVSLQSQRPYHIWLKRGFALHQLLEKRWRDFLKKMKIPIISLPNLLPEASISKFQLQGSPYFINQEHHLVINPPLHASLNHYWGATPGPYSCSFNLQQWDPSLILGGELDTWEEKLEYTIASISPVPTLVSLIREILIDLLHWCKSIGLIPHVFLYEPALPIPYSRKEQTQISSSLLQLLHSIQVTTTPAPPLPQIHRYQAGPGIGVYWYNRYHEPILGPYFTIDLLGTATLFSKELRAQLLPVDRLLLTNVFGSAQAIVQALLHAHQQWWPAPIALEHLLIETTPGAKLPDSIGKLLHELPNLRYAIHTQGNAREYMQACGIALLLSIKGQEWQAFSTGKDHAIKAISQEQLIAALTYIHQTYTHQGISPDYLP
jgi:hypothetical protein